MTVRVKFARHAAHRKAMFRTMVTQLFQYERIQTTLPKAKQLRKFADRMITLAKRDSRAAKAKLCGFVRTEREQHKVITTLAARYADRQGGYTRVLRCGTRRYDAAPMAFIELVDRPGELRPARPTPPSGFIPPAARAALQQSTQLQPNLLQWAAQLQQQRRSLCTAALGSCSTPRTWTSTTTTTSSSSSSRWGLSHLGSLQRQPQQRQQQQCVVPVHRLHSSGVSTAALLSGSAEDDVKLVAAGAKPAVQQQQQTRAAAAAAAAGWLLERCWPGRLVQSCRLAAWGC